MNIRAKLTLGFFAIVTIVLSLISISIYYFSSDYREHDFSRRLRNRAFNTARVLVEQKINAGTIRRMERGNPVTLPEQFIIIFDDSGKEIYSSEGPRTLSPDPALFDRIRTSQGIQYQQGYFDALGFIYEYDGKRYIVMAAANDVNGRDALQNLSQVLLIVFGISLVIVSIVGWYFSGRVLQPISSIVSKVGKITAANLNQRLDEGNKTDELGQLAATFNKMLERLQGTFMGQKAFIANASHEIKTPITIMSGEIEVALLHDREKEQYIKVLSSVLGGLKRLNQLSTHLLLLAQTSAEEPVRNFTIVRIDDIIWELKAELLKAFPHYAIDINFDIHLVSDSLQILGDEHLMKVALLNLLDNGCKYSADNKIVVDFRSDSPGTLGIEFRNTGPGIQQDVIDRVFDPFFRASPSKGVKGFGIGLSLVNRIVKLHGGTIGVKSVPGHETVFSITLPSAAQGAIK
jgi:signal transduction histidine kinase